MTVKSPVNTQWTQFAHRLADQSGVVILRHFRSHGEVDNKSVSSFDPVTEADRAAEATMRRMIEAEFPGHGIAGEEFADKAGSGRYRWVLDPIDGTRSFITGQPIWGTLIGLVEDERPIAGLMNQPYIGERFWSVDDAAYFRNAHGESVIKTRRCGSLGQAVLAATTPDMFKGDEAARFAALSSACRLTRFGGDCYLYCMLAMGFIDIVAESSLKPFDIVPLIPIVEAAGGVVTTWDGGSPAKGGRILAVGDPALYEAAMAALSGR